MFNKKFFLSILVFSVLMIITSHIKTETRLLEKKINQIEVKNKYLKNQIYISQIDYYYLSSPYNLKKKIEANKSIKYEPIKYSNIFLSVKDFLSYELKISKNNLNEKKTKK